MPPATAQPNMDLMAYPKIANPTTGSGMPGWMDLPQGKNAQNTMQNFLRFMFLPYLNQQIGVQGEIGSSFLNQVATPGADFGAASTAAQGYANQLFKPGGQIANQIRTARGNVTRGGFAPSGAEGAENGILNQGVQDVGNMFAQGATGLESQRMNLFSNLYGGTNQNIQDMIQSIFTGYGNEQQLGLAQSSVPKKGLLGLGFGPF
jgi:hypothetical protein